MHCALILSLLAVVSVSEWARSTEAAPPRAEPAEFSGRGYLRLADWGRANHFEFQWLKRDEVLELSNRSSRLVFARDSRDAELNGVNVGLSYPIVFREGACYISELDLERTLAPVLSPPKERSRARVRNIVIDPGHGGKDPGNLDGSHQEKKYTLLLADELCGQLRSAGFKASLTRTTDFFIPREMRPEIARRRAADLFLSLHWNSLESGRSEVRGVQTFCLTPAGASSSNAGGEVIDAGAKPGNRHDGGNMLLAYELQKSLVRTLGLVDRGVRRARFAVLCAAEMPSALIEGGFMSHPAESKRIYDPAYRRQMAQAIVAGVVAYQRQVEGIK